MLEMLGPSSVWRATTPGVPLAAVATVRRGMGQRQFGGFGRLPGKGTLIQRSIWERGIRQATGFVEIHGKRENGIRLRLTKIMHARSSTLATATYAALEVGKVLEKL